MKKSIIFSRIVTCLLQRSDKCTNQKKQREDAKREAWKKERQEKKALKLSRTLYPTSKQLML